MSAPRFSSQEAHQAWLDQSGLPERLNRIGVTTFPTLTEAVVSAAQAEHSRRYWDETARYFVHASLENSIRSRRNSHLVWVKVEVTEEGADHGCDSLPMSFAIYELAPGRFVVLDEVHPGREWSKWEDHFSPGCALIKEQFKIYDADGNGTIELRELKRLLQIIDTERCSDIKVDRLLGQMDTNADGHIQFEEFIDWIFHVNGYSDPNLLVAVETWF